jgi:hypothetical protein
MQWSRKEQKYVPSPERTVNFYKHFFKHCKEQNSPGIAKAVLKPEQPSFKVEECFAVSNEERPQELKSVKNKGAYLEEKLEELEDIISPTISATILPVVATAIVTPISPITPSTVCSAAPNTRHIQSVFVNTTFNTDVSKIASSEFVFPKLKERDKKFNFETSVKSTFAPESLFLYMLLMTACLAAQQFQILDQSSFKNAARVGIQNAKCQSSERRGAYRDSHSNSE